MSFRKIIKKILTYPSFPDFYILGAQKAGTTSIDSYLKNHPEVQGTHPKELHYFDNEDVNEKGLSWYKNHFRRFYFGKRKLLFESTPNYLFSEYLPKELKSIKPDLKFIVILRDPVQRAFSAYNMFKLNYESQKKNGGAIQKHLLLYELDGNFMSFDEVVEKELEEITNNTSKEKFDESFTFIRKGLYRKQLENWYQSFPKNQFLILQFEDLVKDEINTLNKICAFLSISNFDQIQFNKEPRNKREYTEKISEKSKKLLEEFYQNNS